MANHNNALLVSMDRLWPQHSYRIGVTWTILALNPFPAAPSCHSPYGNWEFNGLLFDCLLLEME